MNLDQSYRMINSLRLKILFLLFVNLKMLTFAQASYSDHLSKADELNKINLFAESIEELKLAIALAETNNNESELIDAKIMMGELMRRTQNYENGLEILYSLTNSAKYPKLHVRKLGRMAAIYVESAGIFEVKYGDKINIKDSVELFLSKSLKLAIKNKYKIEEANLRNELGLFLMRQNKRWEAMKHLTISSDIFWKAKDTLSYIVTNVNVLENFLDAGKDKEFKQLSNQLINLSLNKRWYTVEARVFKMIAIKHLNDADSLQYFIWMDRAGQNYIEYFKEKSSEQMKLFEVMYETEKFQNEANKSELKSIQQSKVLEKETIKSGYLSIILFLVFLVLFATGLVLFRERKIKSKVSRINSELNKSNEKYQLLMIESNHRIKNNLQMVISMLEYAGQDVSEDPSKTLERISNKVHTISSLHKHLHTDIHNPLINVVLYFEEIFKIYSEISITPIEISKQLESISIKSERLVYFGLILNELLANSLEHNSSTLLKINVEIRKLEKEYLFIYSDHSLHEEICTLGIGSSLIPQLINRVGGSNFDLEKSTGKYQFSFNA